MLQKLLAKVRQQAHHADTHGSAGAVAAELSALESIVGSKLGEAEKKGMLGSACQQTTQLCVPSTAVAAPLSSTRSSDCHLASSAALLDWKHTSY